jgi:hypothetical protein
MDLMRQIADLLECVRLVRVMDCDRWVTAVRKNREERSNSMFRLLNHGRTLSLELKHNNIPIGLTVPIYSRFKTNIPCLINFCYSTSTVAIHLQMNTAGRIFPGYRARRNYLQTVLLRSVLSFFRPVLLALF